jgi:hypothetical protein
MGSSHRGSFESTTVIAWGTIRQCCRRPKPLTVMDMLVWESWLFDDSIGIVADMRVHVTSSRMPVPVGKENVQNLVDLDQLRRV